MSAGRHRFRFGRRGPGAVSLGALESVLSQPLNLAGADGANSMGFEDAVLSRVGAHRPFLGHRERRRVRWVRMSLIGLSLGLFTTGAIGVRSGLLPLGEGAGPVSAVVQTAQSESLQQAQTVAHWRNEALARFVAMRERQTEARDARPQACREGVALRAAALTAPPERGVCLGLTMRQPVSAIDQAGFAPAGLRVVVFEDGLAVPITGASGPVPVQVKRWPSSVQDSILSIGLEGSGELALPGVVPAWYGSDVVRLPRAVPVGSTEEPRFPGRR